MGESGGGRKARRLEREGLSEKRYRECAELLNGDLRKGKGVHRLPTLTDDFFGKNLSGYIGDTVIQTILGVKPRPKPRPRHKKNVSNFEKRVSELRPILQEKKPPQLLTPARTYPVTPINQPLSTISTYKSPSMNSIPAEPAQQKEPTKLPPSPERPSDHPPMHLPIHPIPQRATTIMQVAQVPQEIPEDPQEQQDGLSAEDPEILRQKAELAACESQYTSSSSHSQPIPKKGGLGLNN
jgi:hypothetical protein